MGAGSPKFVTTLIILDEDNLVEWAQKNRVQFGSYADRKAPKRSIRR
jgi:hypothetical protein